MARHGRSPELSTSLIGEAARVAEGHVRSRNAASVSNLLDEIERGALDSRTSLADTLRKCVMLGGRAGSVELRTWASRELNGYGPDDELPDWRIAAAQIRVAFNNLRYNVTGQAISSMELPDFAQDRIKDEFSFRMGVAAMENLLKGGDTVKFGIPGGQDLLMLINHQNQGSYQNIRSIYWTVSAVAVGSILDRIRTTLPLASYASARTTAQPAQGPRARHVRSRRSARSRIVPSGVVW